MKQAKVPEHVFRRAWMMTGALAVAVLVALTDMAVAQSRPQVPKPAVRAVPQGKARPGPTTVPHTQPAARPQPKPTVVLKPGEVPAISFEQPVWDFGRIKAGEDITHEFMFTNTGNGPLEILEVKPG
jgi:glucose/arabinose dehydrogenase